MKNYINGILWAEGDDEKDESLLVNKFFNLMDEISKSINDYFMENNNTMKQSNILNEIRSDPIIIDKYEKDNTCRYCSELITLHDEKGEKVMDHDHIIHEYRGASHSSCNLKAHDNKWANNNLDIKF